MSDPMSRRRFVQGSGVALGTACIASSTASASSAPSASAADRSLYAYVGFGTEGWNGGSIGGGIKAFRVNMADGSLDEVGATGPEFANMNCDGICTSSDGRFVYGTNRTTAQDGIPGYGGGLYAFAISSTNGSLQHVKTVHSMGSNPSGVMVDSATGRLIASNRGAISRVTLLVKKRGEWTIERPTDDATVALFPLGADGSIGQPLDVAVFTEGMAPGSAELRPEDLGADSMVQNGPACHGIALDSTERWIIATDNGYDHIYVYPHSPSSRRLSGKAYPVAAGTGPRHIAAHPKAPFFFVTNEWSPSISAFQLNEKTGAVRHIQTIGVSADNLSPDKPEGSVFKYDGPSPADVRVHPNGRFVYASTRRTKSSKGGNDTISVYAFNQGTGRLKFVEEVETGGKMQREFNIDPSGKFLFACNMDSNNVTTFGLDSKTGKMSHVATTAVPRAAVISFASL
ncbi:lactonase family protein [Streptomyces rugosispiralis]|uniref:Lactonase family protein n=1 Tax=Streptomyces rugosispiralis TaxID=2967341 RepID=A0ABT1UNF2_9ACTN|nr:beta-propeller fold lactonase family protein [Streptomyces rugosispiralis]MCQ8186671.1 lactonase family protein [Streptomyces rugosispiralis]